jgi:hypothetical protein
MNHHKSFKSKCTEYDDEVWAYYSKTHTAQKTSFYPIFEVCHWCLFQFIHTSPKMSKIYNPELEKLTYWSGRWQSWSSSIVLIAYWICCLWSSSCCCWRGCSCRGCIPSHSKAWCCSLVTPLIPSLHSVQLSVCQITHIYSHDCLKISIQNNCLQTKYHCTVRISKSIRSNSQTVIWQTDKF